MTTDRKRRWNRPAWYVAAQEARAELARAGCLVQDLEAFGKTFDVIADAIKRHFGEPPPSWGKGPQSLLSTPYRVQVWTLHTIVENAARRAWSEELGAGECAPLVAEIETDANFAPFLGLCRDCFKTLQPDKPWPGLALQEAVEAAYRGARGKRRTFKNHRTLALEVCARLVGVTSKALANSLR